jgi:hypothetical protein
MGQLNDSVKNAVLNHIFGKATYTPYANLYLALYNGDPESGGTEIEYTGYARKQIVFADPATRSIQNSNEITFAECDGAKTATHGVILSALTGGDILGVSDLNPVLNIVSGNEPVIPAGTISVNIPVTTVGAGMTDYLVHKILAMVFKNTAFAVPAKHFALSSTAITDAGGNFTEQSGSGYSRTSFSDFTTSTAKQTSNASDITFYTPTADDQDLISSVAVFDAATAGNMLIFDNDTVVDQTPFTGNTIKIKAGSFLCKLL